ncbi:POK18 protein, partial [Pachyramphus minor]|nr:POK18 protein [Pachyramphus minor]
VQKFAGTINWLRQYLGLTTFQIQPLIDLLRGDTDLTAPRSLTPQVKQTIALVEQAIQLKHVWRIDTNIAFQVFVRIENMILFAMITQWNPKWGDPLHVL